MCVHLAYAPSIYASRSQIPPYFSRSCPVEMQYAHGSSPPHFSLIGDLWNQGVCIMSENNPKLGSDSRIPVRKPPLKLSGFGM